MVCHLGHSVIPLVTPWWLEQAFVAAVGSEGQAIGSSQAVRGRKTIPKGNNGGLAFHEAPVRHTTTARLSVLIDSATSSGVNEMDA